MKTQSRVFFLFLFSVSIFKSQDLIIKKDSTRIYCKITSENIKSLTYFLVDPNKLEELDKSLIDKYVFDWMKVRRPIYPALVINDTISDFARFYFTGGVAFPSGDFASMNINNEKAGLARIGFALNAGLTINFNKHFGLGASYFYQSNGCEVGRLDDKLRTTFPGITFSSTATNWLIQGTFGGMHLSFDLQDIKTVTFMLDLQAGLPKFISPQIQTISNNFSNTLTVTQHSGVSRSLAILFGMGFYYKINNDICFKLNINTFNGTPIFTDITVNSTNGSASKTGFKQSVNSINLAGGLILLIN